MKSLRHPSFAIFCIFCIIFQTLLPISAVAGSGNGQFSSRRHGNENPPLWAEAQAGIFGVPFAADLGEAFLGTFSACSENAPRSAEECREAAPKSSLLTYQPTRKEERGGPSMPEVQQFTPYNATNLVDPFTGDFTYNIPLLDVGGYPVNLTYSSGVGMEDEASFVGLGWNLNPGVINRKVRGLPDDLDGDLVNKKFNIKAEEAIGVTSGFSAEFAGYGMGAGGGFALDVTHNSYGGWEMDASLSPGISAGGNGDSKLSGSLKIGLNNREGAYFEPGVGLGQEWETGKGSATFGVKASASISSVEGLKSIDFGTSFSRKWSGYERSQTFGRHSVIDFSQPTYPPSFNLPMKNSSITWHIKVGGELTLWSIGGSIGVHSFTKILKTNEEAIPAFGYMYAQHAGEGRVLHDVNREKDGPYIQENPNLPVTNFTYDLYSATGQGLQAQFRPFRGDAGTVFEPFQESNGFGIIKGGEIGGGNTIHAGADIGLSYSTDITQKWTSGNGLNEQFRFRDFDPANAAFEPVYFKNMGELTQMENEGLFGALGDFSAVKPNVTGEGACSNSLIRDDGSPLSAPSAGFVRSQREPRNTHFSWLTAGEATQAGLERDIISNSLDADGSSFFRDFERVDAVKKKHHISEITVTRDDGARYVYGIPVYNLVQKEVSFNISEGRPGSEPFPATGLVSYSPGVDNSIGNMRGENRFFNEEQVPPHAYAYLLTAVLSADYVDIANDGPTSDDFGTYTKFNYLKAHDGFRWRAPYQQNIAHFNASHESMPDDDLASYTYGEKEVWYISSIETKNFVAEFTLSALRHDGLGVLDENGGLDLSQRLMKLDKIALYAKADRELNRTSATPIKTVHFEYDYSLCPGVPSTFRTILGGGKLTLKKLSFQHAGSESGRLSPYEFFYGYNPAYRSNHSDRWGNYKQPLSDDLNNTRFPYALRDSVLADSFAGAWLLSRIKMPAGGTLEIDYESDSYAYVQDKRAMEMRPIAGFSNRSAGELTPTLYDDGNVNNYLFFTLKHPTDNPDELSEYFEGISKMYFNCMVNVGTGLFEAISGYADVNLDTFGVDFGFKNETTGWLRLELAPHGDLSDDTTEHPVSKATWQLIRKNLPQYLLDNRPPDDRADIIGFLGVAATTLESAGTFFTDIYSFMKGRGKGQLTQPAKSFIRLNSPDMRKFGGGSRVKKLKVSDGWERSGALPADYEQEYSYTMSGQGSGRQISSGVAAYEPLVGGDENPFLMPVEFTVERTLGIDMFLNNLEPFGESFFPAPVVGYRQVRVRNLPKPGIGATGTGFTQHEFYTAKDFPTLATQTSKESIHPDFLESLVFNILFAYLKKIATAAQGYCIELNDMHGKPKALRIFNETGDLLSGQEFWYKTQSGFPNRLDNEVTVINDRTGAPETRLVGVEHDFILDARESTHEAWSGAVQLNVDGFQAGPVPIYLFLGYPAFSYAITQYKGITATKVIQRAGILDSVISFDLGSRIRSRNLAWDGLTGMVLVTETQNEFGGAHFKTDIPARWVYRDGMGPACLNTAVKNTVRMNSGTMTGRFFVPGDALVVKQLGVFESLYPYREVQPRRAWVLSDLLGVKFVVDENGAYLPDGEYEVKILRSGRRNMQSVSLGSVVTLSNPLAVPGHKGMMYFDRVLDAAAVEYGNYWQTYTGFKLDVPADTCTCSVADSTVRQDIYSFISALLRNPDFQGERMNINSPPLPGRNVLNSILGSGTLGYSVRREGSRLVIHFTGSPGTGCTFELQAEDHSLFPSESIFFTSGVVPDPVNSRSGCEDSYAFPMNGNYQNSTGNHNISLRVSSSCLRMAACKESEPRPSRVYCSGGAGATVNPYLLGILGNWRPLATYKYVTNRLTGADPRERGIYDRFDNFWSLPGGFELGPVANAANWQRAERSMVIDPFGKTLETKDALGRYAAQLQGYGFSVQTASGANARYRELAFDGFEDYQYRNSAATPFSGACTLPPHWQASTSARRNAAQSHTGKFSLEVRSPVTISRVAIEPCEVERTSWTPAATYQIQPCDLVGTFAPMPGKHLLSVWVRQSEASIDSLYSAPYVTLRLLVPGGWTTRTIAPSGPIIEGWQQVLDTFSIFIETSQMEVIFGTRAETCYFDDCRIQPFNSAMNAYVYDPVSLRLMAVLDDNNFATVYEYDQEGLLSRTKQETNEGIVTVQEVKAGKPKGN